MTRVLLVVLTLLTVTIAQHAMAIPVQPYYQDIKLPTQAMIEHQTITTPIVATTNYVLTTNAGPTSTAAVTVTSFAHQPDVPRNITITPTGTTGDVEACAIVVSGTNIFDKAISETFTFSADASSAVVGAKAFKTVTSIVWPANCESGGFAATWIVGVGSKLGLKRCMDMAGDMAWTVLGGTKETTLGIGAADSTHIESNTVTPNGSMDGTKNVDAFFVQNYRCFP